MRMPLLLFAALALGVAGGGLRRASAAEDYEKIEKAIGEEKQKVLAIWLALATDLGARDLKAEAADAVARARALFVEVPPEVEAASQRVEVLAGAGKADEEAAKRIGKARREAAKCYEKMAVALKREQQDLRYVEFLTIALQLESTKARVKVLSDMAQKEPLLLRAPGTPFAALLSLPKAWKPGKEWPVLVCVEGEGLWFPGRMDSFRGTREDRGVILVCPFTFSSGEELKFDRYPAYTEAMVRDWNGRRLAFDEEGLPILLDFVAQEFGGARKVAITGYAKGGLLAHRMLFRFPERVLGAALASARFEESLREGTDPVAGGGPPVLLLTGDQDPNREAIGGTQKPGIDGQTDLAKKALLERGFQRVTHTVLPGVDSSDCAKEVWRFVDGLQAR